MHGTTNSTGCLNILSQLVLPVNRNNGDHFGGRVSPNAATDAVGHAVATYGLENFKELFTLASSHHVIMRTFPALRGMLVAAQNDSAEYVANAIAKEQARIDLALSFLSPICRALEQAGDVIVIKSLDHWPDLGSDLDLYTNAKSDDIVAIMRDHFKAQLAERSWGDRLANKRNFIVPGLPELVEIHVGRLGQTGEQTALTRSLASRSQTTERMGYTFRTSAPEDRIVISTLQRMYRHFYIRLCDIADNGHLLDEGLVDYGLLQTLGTASGLWEGIATYLRIVSEFLRAYRGDGVPLPSSVTGAAKFGLDQCHFRKDFLRVPILPHSLNLYAAELRTLILKGDLRNGFRLSLLPGLATAAAIEQKITGSDK